MNELESQLFNAGLNIKIGSVVLKLQLVKVAKKHSKSGLHLRTVYIQGFCPLKINTAILKVIIETIIPPTPQSISTFLRACLSTKDTGNERFRSRPKNPQNLSS